MNRVSQWTNKPGNWDVLNFSHVFGSHNSYGIPDLAKSHTIEVSGLIPWGSKPKLLDSSIDDNTAVHFFLDDYRFESIWKSPERNLDVMQYRGLALSPDFSLWVDMPPAMQIWNVYRNRYIGAYWQQHGIHVIPTVSWSNISSYNFCFLGIEQGSQVAISTVGVIRDKAAHKAFRNGFDAMIEVIQPSSILCYGSLSPLNIQTDIPITEYPSRWEQIRGKLS
jgi:hypothetical protein